MAGPVGFGMGANTEGLVPTVQELEGIPPAEQMAADIHAIKERYVLAAGLRSDPFSVIQNGVQKFDYSQTEYNALMVTVTSGVVFIYLGDATMFGGAVGPPPPIVQSAGIVPTTQTYPLPPGNYIVCVQGNGGAAAGCLTPMAL